MLETIKPIQSILMMAFFLSIGLLLDIGFIWEHLGTVLLLLFVITIGKTALNIGILRFLHLPWSQAFLVGVVLAQLGEFAFLMASISSETHLISEFGERLIIGLTVLSLAFSPLWLACAKRLRALADVNSIPLKGIVDLIYGENVPLFRKMTRRVKSYFFKKPVKNHLPSAKIDDWKEPPKAPENDNSKAEF